MVSKGNIHVMPYQKITIDTIEFKYYEVDSKEYVMIHKFYLHPFMDMFNTEMLGYVIDKYPSAKKFVSAKYSCGFPDPQVSPIIVVDRYLDYFTTIMEDRLWQVLAKPVFR